MISEKHWLAIFCLNLLGILLFYSLYPADSWQAIDVAVFRWSNQTLATNETFRYLVAYTNHRYFDAVALLLMCFLYLIIFLQQSRIEKRRMIAIGLMMLFTGLVLSQATRYLPVPLRVSPTGTLPNVYRLSEIVPFPCKDLSLNSFPGDHGLMLMIFTAFLLRYFPRWRAIGILALGLTFVLAAPRVLSGAHWLTDVVVGALSIAMIGLSWLLLTPCSDIGVRWFDRCLQKIGVLS